MKRLVKIWVMISDPNPEGETRTVPFCGKTIEECMKHLHAYLDLYTGPGTRAEVVQSGYIYTGASHGRRQKSNTAKEQSSVD